MINRIENQAVCFLCSILDEQTKSQRSIVYDSPAATKKVFDVCQALQSRFKNVYVLTMARGQQKGNRKTFVATVKQTSRLPVIYARFYPVQLLTYFISAISLFVLVGRLIRQKENCIFHFLVYNRNWLYVPCLIFARLSGARCYLDLEDGSLVESTGALARIKNSMLKFTFDLLCRHGSILVSPGLKAQVKTSNNIICYGVAKQPVIGATVDWSKGALHFLLGGSLMRETGVQLLIDAVRILNRDFKNHKDSLKILITGHGPLADELAHFAQDEGKGWLDFKGRVTKSEYDNLLRSSHVGLCLKLPSCEMGTTTFPSKVIEIAAQGKLVLTTKLGHVSELFGAEGAQYLEDENPQTLANAIVSVVSDREAALRSARSGQQRVLKMCSPEKVADEICRLFEGNLAK